MAVENFGRREELVDFLRSRRARLTPVEMGLISGPRRRTPGLRREEVAQLAGISTTWYTWLEQGRDVRVSVDVIESLARALRLGESERRHLHDLAGHGSPPAPPRGDAVPEPIPAVLELVSRIPDPVYVQGPLWQLVAWNRAVSLCFADFGSLEVDDRNLLRYVFTSRARTNGRLLNWQEWASFYVAQFRADTTRLIGDPAWVALVEELSENEQFSRLWATHDVHGHLHPGPKVIEHVHAGRLVLNCMMFRIDAQPELTMVVHSPVPGTGTAERLTALLDTEGHPEPDSPIHAHAW